MRIACVAAIIFISLIVGAAKVRNTNSDPQGTLLVSQNILQLHSIQLDSFGRTFLEANHYPIEFKNNHIYDIFPLGSALFSVPFVAIANAVGLDMRSAEPATQIVIVEFVSITSFFFLFLLARQFLLEKEALFISLIFWLGTSFSSTNATALWSHDFSTLFALIALYCISNRSFEEVTRGIIIGALLFAAYLCRPTFALFAGIVLTSLFFQSKRIALLAAISLATLMVGFVAFSFHEFNQLLPSYYLPQRLSGGYFFTALYGNTFSPARGLFIFSPFLLLPFVFSVSAGLWNRKHLDVILIGIAWPLMHLIFISRFPHWWAGYSFGPRLMTDVLPGLFLLLLFTWPSIRPANQIFKIVLISLAVFSFYVNTYKGLFDIYSAQWNAEPSVDTHPELLFDWKYPQFLHSKARHKARLIEYEALLK